VRSPWISTIFRAPRQRGPSQSTRIRGSLAKSLLLALLPLNLALVLGVAVLVYLQARSQITEQITAQLTAIALLKEDQIGQWADARAEDVNSLARSPDLVEATEAYLRDPDVQDADLLSAAGLALEARLKAYLAGNAALEALMLAQPDTGEVLLDTSDHKYLIHKILLDSSNLRVARRRHFLVAPDHELGGGSGRVMVVAPVIDSGQAPIALIFGLLRDEQLSGIAALPPGLGDTRRAYLLTGDNYVLGSPAATQSIQPSSQIIETALINRENGYAIYADQSGQTVLGVFSGLPQYGMTLVVEESELEAHAPIRKLGASAAVVGVLGAALNGALVIFFTRRLTRPLRTLTDRALRMAGGSLPSSGKTDRQDDIGLLIQAFNSMGGELRGLNRDLDSKVAARTKQLSSAVEVGRAATSILSTEQMLARTADLIQDRFGYYHVSIFLLDDSGRFAVLREATGDIGSELKARGHRLEVGSSSLVGWVTANRKGRIALDADAGTDPAQIRTEFLHGTRSQVAVPLRVGDRLVGALDVHSREANAFSQADIDTLQVLADQIAVAVENGRLFTRQERAAQLEQRTATVTARIYQSPTVDAMLESTASELGRVFGVRKVVVRLTPETQPQPVPPEAVEAAPRSPANGGRTEAGDAESQG